MENLKANNRLNAVIALLVTIVLWGSAFVAIRIVATSNTYTAGQLSASRMIIAAVILGIIIAVRGGVQMPQGRDWFRFFVLGLMGQSLYHVLLNAGEHSVDAGTASLLISIAPLLSSLLAVAFLGERLSGLGWLGTVLGAIGAAVIAASSGLSLSGGIGALLVLGATCLWAAYLVIQKTMAARYDILALTAWPMWIGAILLLPFTWGLPHTVRLAPVSATLAIVWLATFCSVAAFLTWAYALKRLNVMVASSALYCVPVAAFAISVIALGETPSAGALLGGAAAIAGVVLVQLKGRPAARQDEIVVMQETP